MPPKSVSSALALISLSVLTAVEAGGCDKRPESLASATRTALPWLARATRQTSTEPSYALSDYGLGSHPGLRHICGHYEIRADGRLTTWDLFAGALETEQLRLEVDGELAARGRHGAAQANARRPGISVSVEQGARFSWPRHCPKPLPPQAQSVLVAKRVL